jgi:hypothetical protein
MMDYRALLSDIQEVYLGDDVPWVIGFSGGKDSTTVLQMVFYALSELPKEKLSKEIHVLSNDTLVENPAIVEHVNQQLKKIEVKGKTELFKHNPELFRVVRVVPKLEDTFWVNLIGKGYPSPNRWFRWCTERMKVLLQCVITTTANISVSIPCPMLLSMLRLPICRITKYGAISCNVQIHGMAVTGNCLPFTVVHALEASAPLSLKQGNKAVANRDLGVGFVPLSIETSLWRTLLKMVTSGWKSCLSFVIGCTVFDSKHISMFLCDLSQKPDSVRSCLEPAKTF